MPSAWTLAYRILWLAPVPLALAWGALRLAPADRRWPAWPTLVVAGLALAPAAGGTLLVASRLVDAASPLAAPWTLAVVAATGAGFAALAWALTHPRAEPYRLAVPAVAAVPLLLGLVAGPSLVGHRFGAILLVLAVGLPLVVLAAAAPGAAQRWWLGDDERARWLGPAALAVFLAVLTVAAGGFALVEAAAGNTTTAAVHEVEARLDPSGEGAWAATVPFPTAANGTDPVLDELRDRVRVVEGDATVRWAQPGRLAVEGEGPALVRARYAFYGDIGQREAFNGWHLANDTVAREPGGPANLTVTWHLDASGGEGHTCWATGRAQVTLTPGEAAVLDGSEEGGRFWSVVCA